MIDSSKSGIGCSDELRGCLFDVVEFPVLIVRASDGRIVESNPAARRFYGKDPSQPEGSLFSDLEARSEEDGRIRSAGFPIDDAGPYRLRHCLFDGTIRDVEIRSARFSYQNDEYRAVIISDATNVMKTESQLQEALRRAETAGRARSEFLANASHEFRTPVSGIIGIAALLRESGLDDDQKHLLSLMDGAAKDLERMLRDLLDISRIDVGKVQIKRETFDVARLVDRVVGLHSSNAAGKGLDLSWSHQGRAAFFGDETRLAQVLGNLLSNAVKYTDEGGITVQSICDSDLDLVVTDTGKGVPDDKKAEIFEMFRQVENPYTKERPGLGLGLAIVRSLLDLMGGTVDIEDGPEVGSRFLVHVPRPPDAPGPGEADESRRKSAVLVVEDDPLSRYYLATILRKRGFEVEDVADGETALEMYDPDRYLVILMDVGLPHMSGIDVAREWRAREQGVRRTPIWAVTAHGFQSDKDRCFESGMDEFYLKPVDEAALTAKLMELAEADNGI